MTALLREERGEGLPWSSQDGGNSTHPKENEVLAANFVHRAVPLLCVDW